MMVVDIGSSNVGKVDLTAPCYTRFDRTLQVGDLVRATDALNEESLFGAVSKAVRAGTVGVVAERVASSSSAVVNWTGYFDHPLGLPMVMERSDASRWLDERKRRGPVQRILPSGQFEQGLVLAAERSSSANNSQTRQSRPLNTRSLCNGVMLEAPLESLEVSNGFGWQPMSAATAERRQAMALLHTVGLPYLRRISEGRASCDKPLIGWGHGEGFLRPGADTSMVHDVPVLAYDGTDVGREFNLIYIDEEAEYAVVGMGSASGALYSANVSLRMLPLADVYMPFSKVISRSTTLDELLELDITTVMAELLAPHERRTERPYLRYRGKPLPPGDSSLFGMLRKLVGAGGGLDGNESVSRAWEQLRFELVEMRGREAVQGGIDASGTIELPLELFCVCVGRRQLPVYLDVAKPR